MTKEDLMKKIKFEVSCAKCKKVHNFTTDIFTFNRYNYVYTYCKNCKSIETTLSGMVIVK